MTDQQTPTDPFGKAPLTASYARKESLRELLTQYIAECGAEGQARTSIDSKRNAILRFCMHSQTPDVSAAEIEAWVDDMKTNYSYATQHLHLTLVRGFFKWMVANGTIAESPFVAHKVVFNPRKKVDKDVRAGGFTTHEIARMRQAVDDLERYGSKGRKADWLLEHRLVFMLALTTGMRLGEMSSIRLSEFEDRGGVLWLNVPKAKWHEHGRYIRIERETTYILKDYVKATADARSRTVDADYVKDYLFPAGSRGSARQRIITRMQDIMNAAETTEDSKGRRRQLLHSFRKTAISAAVMHGATGGEIESAFGVSSQVAQQHYINPTLNARHDAATAAADNLVAAANTPVDRFVQDIWSPWAGSPDSVPLDERIERAASVTP